MTLLQALRYQPSALSAGLPIGRPRTVLCQGRCCTDRTAPVFVALGVRGALVLCAACRAWQHRIIRAVVPELRREA